MRLTTEEILHNSFVVTIDGERVALFNSWFASQGLAVPKAFTGYELPEMFLKQQFQCFRRFPAAQDFKRMAAICNNASHWAIVQHAKFMDLPFVTIFEDDAKPVDGLQEKLDLLCSDIPEETDVLRLGYTSMFKRHTARPLIDNAIPHSDNLIVSNLSGSHAYIVFRKYYDRFIIDNKLQPRCDLIKINPSKNKIVFALKESLFNQVNLPDRPVISSWKFEDGTWKR